jgi:hypothetical protein
VRLRSWPGTGFDRGTLLMPYAPDRCNRNKKNGQNNLFFIQGSAQYEVGCIFPIKIL